MSAGFEGAPRDYSFDPPQPIGIQNIFNVFFINVQKIKWNVEYV